MSKYFIFSVEQANLDAKTNRVNTLKVGESLTTQGISYKPVEGYYTHNNGTVSEEISFIVKANNEQVVLDLAKKYNQESILFVDKGHGFLIYPATNETVKLQGKMREVTDTNGLVAYTKVDNKYYSIV